MDPSFVGSHLPFPPAPPPCFLAWALGSWECFRWMLRFVLPSATPRVSGTEVFPLWNSSLSNIDGRSSKARSGCENDRREKRREGTTSSAGDLPTNETGVEPCGGQPDRSVRTKGPRKGVDERHVAIFSHHRRIVDTGGSLTEPSNSAHTPSRLDARALATHPTRLSLAH
jgi:hypothetical protein